MYHSAYSALLTRLRGARLDARDASKTRCDWDVRISIHLSVEIHVD